MSAEAESWQNFYVMAGGAAAALTGLVLVAISLHVRTILSHPLFRDRAFTSLQGLVRRRGPRALSVASRRRRSV